MSNPLMKKLASKSQVIEHVIAKQVEDLKDDALLVAVHALAQWAHKRKITSDEIIAQVNYTMSVLESVAK